jgi:hypothetical protein
MRVSKSRESNEPKKKNTDSPATNLLPRPANFPLRSPESRAAARAMVRPGELREGDKGKTAGVWWSISKDEGTGSLRAVCFGEAVSPRRPGILLASGVFPRGTRREELEKVILDKMREGADGQPEQDRVSGCVDLEKERAESLPDNAQHEPVRDARLQSQDEAVPNSDC